MTKSLTSFTQGLIALENSKRYNLIKGKKGGSMQMKALKRITFDPGVMGGKPCIRGMRVTVGMIIGLVASGHAKEDILKLYPYLEPEDIDEALAYAVWRVEEIDLPLAPATA
jgi:uncharacterized protein (DUF433 family)